MHDLQAVVGPQPFVDLAFNSFSHTPRSDTSPWDPRPMLEPFRISLDYHCCMTREEARQMIVDGIDYAAYKETDSSLHDSDKNRLFGSEQCRSGRAAAK